MDSCCFLGSVPSKSHWASPSSLSLQSYTLFRDEDCSLTMCQLLPYRTVWPGRLSVIWLRPTPWTHPCLSSSSLHLYAPTACTVPLCAFASAIPWGCEAHSILSTQQICVLPLKAGDNYKAFSFSLRKKNWGPLLSVHTPLLHWNSNPHWLRLASFSSSLLGGKYLQHQEHSFLAFYVSNTWHFA